jgi:hypothetical protein
MEGGDNRSDEAPFNMAIATLQRLDTILQQIRRLNTLYPIDSVEKQKSHISLVRDFYINSIPLFKEEKVEGKEDKLPEIEKEILDNKLETKNLIKSGSQIYKTVYSQELEKRLNEIMIYLLRRLKKYFMPGKRDAEGLI